MMDALKYREAGNLIRATRELLDYFKDYEDLREIASLNRQHRELSNDLRLKILDAIRDIQRVAPKELPKLLKDVVEPVQ